MCKNIVETVLSVQNGNRDDILYLTEKFTPLLKKYANLLNDDDAFGDLLLFFIEKIHTININGFMHQNGDSSFISYINKCVKNKYILLSKQKINRNDMVDIELVGDICAVSNEYSDFEFFLLISNLTEFQQEILKMIYFYGYSVKQISEIKHISRQCVNQAKNRALDKLRQQLDKT
ncbi:MAG: sigma-70 family RNA polymerase sigma factor [Oscillospiraceae bacterium]|jgi:RNA polymerase sigma factor (sigma-70 family)|nr:sigma-70 family RNA polymerase sigma factor [Oscillospiraceae bacterium]